MSSREEILKRLRDAPPGRGAEEDEVTEEELRSRIRAALPREREKVIELFQRELENADGTVIRVSSSAEAGETVRGVLAKHSCRSMAVSPEKETASLLEGLDSGVRIVHTAELRGEERKSAAAEADAGLVYACCGVADTGSLVFSTRLSGTSYPHFLPETVIALVDGNSISPSHAELMEQIPASSAEHLVMVTGPSRTADIEKILILGAHGPKHFYAVVSG